MTENSTCRILTVRQPWAWAIMHGGKNVENRVRNVAGDYRGPVLIHAAKTFDLQAPRELFAISGADSEGVDCGAIIGVVDLVAVHLNTDPSGCMPSGSQDGRLRACSPWAEAGAHHLVLENPRALDRPLPYTGMLGLRRTDFKVMGDVLVEDVARCTCAGGGDWPHEPTCGFDLVAHLVATS